MHLSFVLPAFGLSILAVVAVGGVWLHLSTKKLLAMQAHELAVKQLELQAAVAAALLELRELRELRGRVEKLEKAEKSEKSEKKAAAFGDNFDVSANAHADEAQGNLSKLQRTILDRKTTLSPIKK
jgi:hypothetical protein